MDTATPIHTERSDDRAPVASSPYDTAAIMGGLYGDGIIGLKGAFTREWVQQLRDDVDAAYQDALARPGGTVGRGPHRHYVEIHPEDIAGFTDLVMHPWVTAVCEAVLGPEYKIVELGFDVPNPGAQDQPWHRDFPAPSDTLVGRSRSHPARSGTSPPGSSTRCSRRSPSIRDISSGHSRRRRRWVTSRRGRP